VQAFLGWGARGPEFKSRRPDQIPQRVKIETFTTGRANGLALSRSSQYSESPAAFFDDCAGPANATHPIRLMTTEIRDCGGMGRNSRQRPKVDTFSCLTRCGLI
jgi:hypothetical protein